MGGTEILLIAAVIVIPLVIAIAVTLWTLEPAARRAERAKRGRKRSGSTESDEISTYKAPISNSVVTESAKQVDRPTDTP